MSQHADPESTALFSRAYLRPAASLPDSKRFRTRLHSAWENVMSDHDRAQFYTLVRSELGITIPGNDFGAFYSRFFETGELRDVLDSISLTFRILAGRQLSAQTSRWLTRVARIFHEEALGYTVNEHGAVRYLVDEEFERTRVSTLSGLGAPRFSAVRTAVETAFSKLDREPFQTKEAVRSMFEAAETLCKLLGDHNDDLDEGMIRKRLQPVISRAYSAVDASAQSFAEQTLAGFAKWVNAGHKYRHGPKAEEPHDPPLELAVAFLSQGAAYIRFLIHVAAKRT